ncbi:MULTISPECIES: prepilin-type N-terminal cleavage/methylation domain-containing protein [unclassified Neptuniibacter]|uniref:type II secretion system protein n=1 Tax=unclassified Neptuniibacter TaxID=2630693 RepID=UPI0025EEA14C|nr:MULTISPECIES: prepilin-type N-terminal cleavage/methylation domain-containing protein [unclassified Neptuniibacter]
MMTSKMKESIAKFMKADLSQVKDTELRAKGEKLQSKQGGFTLLELLVVVAILAIIAGSVIASLDGKEEGAAQATAVHTMATLESGLKVFETTEKRTLPEELESMICVGGFDTSVNGELTLDTDDLSTAAAAAILLGNGVNTSNVARIHGGLTEDKHSALTVEPILQTTEVFGTLQDAGLTSLRYTTLTLCNDVAGDLILNDDAGTAVNDVALVDVTKPNLVFRDPVFEGDEWEYGAGAAVDLTTTLAAESVPIAFHTEPEEIGADDDDIVAVFGIGPDSSLTNEIIGRAPSDGNVGPDKYGHFTLAVVVGECEGGIEEDGTGSVSGTDCTDPANWDSDDGVRVLAVLDGGGDAYDDEIAEAKGNEEE